MSVLEDYMPWFTFIGIAMLSVVISITAIVLYIKLIFWLKEKYGSLSTFFKWRLVISSIKYRICKSNVISEKIHNQKKCKKTQDRNGENKSRFHTGNLP